MRKGYFKGDCVTFGVNVDGTMQEYVVYYSNMHLTDPALDVEITDNTTKLAFFVKNFLGDKYYELEDSFVSEIEKKFKDKNIEFVDVESEN